MSYSNCYKCKGLCSCGPQRDDPYRDDERVEKSLKFSGEPYEFPLKRSMSFLTTQELFSYKAIPALAVCSYMAMSVGTIANRETFVQ